MAYDALRTLLPIAGWPEDKLRQVEISGGAVRLPFANVLKHSNGAREAAVW